LFTKLLLQTTVTGIIGNLAFYMRGVGFTSIQFQPIDLLIQQRHGNHPDGSLVMGGCDHRSASFQITQPSLALLMNKKWRQAAWLFLNQPEFL
jgi:hypothetical protein